MNTLYNEYTCINGVMRYGIPPGETEVRGKKNTGISPEQEKTPMGKASIRSFKPYADPSTSPVYTTEHICEYGVQG